MLSCRKATELIEKKLLIKLSFKENVQLQLHKSMCSACTAYEKQSKKMDELFHKNIQNIDTTQPEATINEGLKKKITDTLSEN
jgi:hypothetical protein